MNKELEEFGLKLVTLYIVIGSIVFAGLFILGIILFIFNFSIADTNIDIMLIITFPAVLVLIWIADDD